MDGYEHLVVAVLVRAAKDTGSRNPKIRKEARAWLRSDGLAVACALIDVSARTAGRLRGAGMAETNRHPAQ